MHTVYISAVDFILGSTVITAVRACMEYSHVHVFFFQVTRFVTTVATAKNVPYKIGKNKHI